MTDRSQHLPGRLAEPGASLQSDPRADPRIIAALAAINGFEPAVAPIALGASYEECLTYCSAFEKASAAGNDQIAAALPAFNGITTSAETITGVDDNDITLHVHKPNDVSGAVPCIVHTHGGGMVLMTAEDPMFVRTRSTLAERGMVIIGVEFRNGGGRLGNHPFPAGLNDCASAVKWVHANRTALGISRIVISGESGGGNLACATTLKAHREGWSDHIDGVYAMCPYIYGGYAHPSASLLSLYENDGYGISCQQMAALVTVYDPTGENSKNPLAWPYHAATEDLKGLPPHFISVNELDPLRDEGLAYYRKLLAADVPAVARTVHGTPHAGDLSYPDITPDIFAETMRSIHGFACSL